ncbi:MAG: hypothetical protein JW913_17220 [Chitinispirillaceae bacterium]|nr:hypothetical protein [Chitinispirillaceae bacterium]
MTLHALLVITLILGATSLALFHALREEVPRWKKNLFIAIRLLIGALLTLALLEPAFTVRRLPERNRPVPVLIDASRSMSLFPADSAIRLLQQVLSAAGHAASPGRRRAAWFLFGDSLRATDDPTRTAADRRSYFPSMNSLPVLQKATDIIIISDANWSNPTPVAADLASKSVWYLPLNTVRRPPSIECSPPDTIVSYAGTTRSMKVPCTGFASEAATVTVTVAENAAPLFVDSLAVAAGPFAHAFDARLPPAAAGLHLYTVTVANRRDTLSRSRYVLHHAVPEAFVYRTFSARPSLDLRFFRLALARSQSFVDGSVAHRKRVDVVFIFGDGQADMAIPAAALPVYCGCLPGKTVRIDSIAGTRLFLPECGMPSPFFQLPLRDLPPIASMVRNPQVVPACPWLSAAVGNDTVALLFSGIHRKRSIIACAFTGFWRWDFLPLSHASGEAETFIFSQRLIEAVISTLHALRTDTLLVFPSGQPTAGDAVRLTCVIPSFLHSSEESIHLPCSIGNDDGTFHRDTLIEFLPSGPLLQRVSIPPLDSGNYSVGCSLSTPLKTVHSSVPFTVAADNGELLVTGQNESVLREIGQPLDTGADGQLTSPLRPPDRTLVEQTVNRRIVIKRSWWLLIALLLLLGIEWGMRRFARLD